MEIGVSNILDRMNIYTLHKEGSFQPPSLDCDDNIPPNPSLTQQTNTNLNVLADKKNPHCATSVTSGTSGTGTGSSLGERTTPRHNTRAVISRIDATGLITDSNATEQMKAKAAMNTERKQRARERVKKDKVSHHLNKAKRNGLIHIQAKDEFMIFEDNTDLVSHITTPSAVRTSPLESDYLVIDHDEFAEEEDLFSAITVPKTLRKKKHKKRKSRKNTGAMKASGKENREEGKGKPEEQRDLKLMSSTEETEEGEEREEPQQVPQQVPPASPPKVLRTNSLDRPKDNSSKGSNGSAGSTRSPNLRGGKRNSSTPAAEDEEKEDNDHASQHEEAEKNRTEVTSVHGPYDEEKNEKIPQESKEIAKEREASKSMRSVLTPESPDLKEAKSQDLEVASQPSPAISRPENFDATPEKSQPSHEKEHDSSVRNSEHKNENESRKLDYENTSTSSPAKKEISHHSASYVPYGTNRDVDVKEAGAVGLDITATTARLDATNIEAATERSNDLPKVAPSETRRIPKSRKPKKSSRLWWLSTEQLCCNRRKRREQMEKEQSEPLTFKSAVDDSNAFGKTKQERRNSK